jgi:hypothetical protein
MDALSRVFLILCLPFRSLYLQSLPVKLKSFTGRVRYAASGLIFCRFFCDSIHRSHCN